MIAAFQRISDNLGPKELILMWECLHQEIIDSIANERLLHLNYVLSLLIATVEIINRQGISGELKTNYYIALFFGAHCCYEDICRPLAFSIWTL